MASKKAKAAIEAANAKIRNWTYHVDERPGYYRGIVKTEEGLPIFAIIEDQDYNQLSRLLSTSKYMQSKTDMKGLAEYLWDRGLVPMEKEERDYWKKKKIVPLKITLS